MVVLLTSSEVHSSHKEVYSHTVCNVKGVIRKTTFLIDTVYVHGEVKTAILWS